MQNAKIRGDKEFLKKYHSEKLSKEVQGYLQRVSLLFTILCLADYSTRRAPHQTPMSPVAICVGTPALSTSCIYGIDSHVQPTLYRPHTVRFREFPDTYIPGTS